jgi:hypothetical protein
MQVWQGDPMDDPAAKIEWYGPSPPWAPAERQAREHEDAARLDVLRPMPMTAEQVADFVERVRVDMAETKRRARIAQLATKRAMRGVR